MLIEHGRHRRDGFQLRANLIEKRRLEHAGGPRGGIAVFAKDVPATKNDVVEGGELDEVANAGRAIFGALAEANSAELGQRPHRRREFLADGVHAGNDRRADCAQSDEQNPELAGGRRDVYR